ncbi:MAG: hypothetical protein ABIA04_12200 [Pseudomonadota bacterium]
MKKITFLALLVFIMSSLCLMAEDTSFEDEKFQVNRTKYFGVGGEIVNTTTARANTLSLFIEPLSYLKIGANFGFLDNFESYLVGPKFHITYLKRKYFNLFVQIAAYYSKGLSEGDGYQGNTLLGVELFIPDQKEIGFSIAHGLVWEIIDPYVVSFANTSLIGNIALHFYF